MRMLATGLSVPLLMLGFIGVIEAQTLPVVKTQAPINGMFGYDCTIDKNEGTVYVVEFDGGVAWRYNLDLSPAGFLDKPAETTSGIAHNPNDNFLYWYDFENSSLIVTSTMGSIEATYPMTSPAASLLCLTIDEDANTIWASDYDSDPPTYHEFTTTGVYTGNTFTASAGLGAEGSGGGVTWRSDDGDFDLLAQPNGALGGTPPLFVSKHDATGTETGASRIDTATGVFVFPIGLAFTETGSDGEPSLYLVDTLAAQVFELEPIPGPPSPSNAQFIRADADGSGGFNALVDALYLLVFGFQGGPAPICFESADADNDGAFNALVDTLFLLAHGFQGGPAPAAPYPTCGEDPDLPNSLGCEVNSSCPSP